MLRSDKANRYYHKCVKNEIAKEVGITPQETHERLLIMFALIDIKETEYIVESTTTMDKERFWMFIEQCKSWAISQLNINIKGWCSFGDYKPKTIKK